MTKEVIVISTRDIDIIKAVLEKKLFVPNEKLKPFIIKELLMYLKLKFLDKNYKIKVFIAKIEINISGFVICQIEPHYKSRNRKCGTFGWLNVENIETCQALLKACEEFILENNIKLIRGNINFPKGLGGIGFQTEGFKEQILYGVAFNNPRINIFDFLEKCEYREDSEYFCMTVTAKTWTKGKSLDKNIILRHLKLSEIKERKNEILNLANSAFRAFMPDSTTGAERFDEMMEIYSKIPNHFYKLKKNLNFRDYTEIPEFLEDWEKNTLENRLTWMHLAIDRNTNEIVGVIITLPDLYQLWLNEPITRANVDTVMMNPNYAGRGIFSSLNNFGQLTSRLNGITYFEGTGIWSANEDAMRTILPHCEINRKFIIFQKRIKKIKEKK